MEVKKIIKAYKRCKKERDEYLAGWKRAKADLLNYKKDETDRTKKLLDMEKCRILAKIIPILDNFKRAEEEIKKGESDNGITEGITQIKRQLEDFLKKEGLEEISATGEEFDPNFHEAVEMVDGDKKDSGKVIEEIEKGYKLDEIIIRPSKVKVIK